jgi:hypothetical protein
MPRPDDRRSRFETILYLGHLGIYGYVNQNPDASDDELDVRVRNVMAGSPINPTHQFGGVLVKRFDFPFIQDRAPGREPTNMPIASTSRRLVTEESFCSVDTIVDHLCLL